jgi:hypothetical protein
VTRVADPLGAVNGETVVALAAERGLTGVDPHADTHLAVLGPGVGAQRLLSGKCGANGVASLPEAEEERIALRVDLRSSRLFEGAAEKALMIGENVGISVAEPPHKRRRAFDVGEKECDCAGGKLGHVPSLPRSAASD